VTSYDRADGEPTDQELWDEAAAGSGAAFGRLFDRHARAVYNHCFRLTASWPAAEDHVSATFLQAWRRRDVRLRNASALPWLLTIATNVVRTERRSLRRRMALITKVGGRQEHVADHADDVAARLDDEQRMAPLLEAVRRLPRGEREAVALCVWSGVSYADAAAVLGIAEGSVRARVSRARTRLARQFAEPHPTSGGVAFATHAREDR
jgi:RNA polymerase sigma-70 factor (ECF subfamily)